MYVHACCIVHVCVCVKLMTLSQNLLGTENVGKKCWLQPQQEGNETKYFIRQCRAIENIYTKFH